MASKRRGWRGIIARCVTLAIVGGLALAAYFVGFEAEDARIDRKRASNFAQFLTGKALSGTPELGRFNERLQAAGFTPRSPIFMRVFKREFELELWAKRNDRFEHFATYPICNWSGRLGPKLREGDRQAPEGFYTVDAKALNPQSRWHRSFNLGFPNAFDRANARTGSLLMVHGGCSSIGCFAMTNAVIDELWEAITGAFANGQKRVHVHVFPFRMTAENMAALATHKAAPFWQTLKAGHDAFEATHQLPEISICNRRYDIKTASNAGATDAINAEKCDKD
jgi:murein L,D-transpeptidase YafK